VKKFHVFICKFFPFLVIKTSDLDLDPDTHWPKMLDLIRIQANPDSSTGLKKYP
jgi:hypothetical protein